MSGAQFEAIRREAEDSWIWKKLVAVVHAYQLAAGGSRLGRAIKSLAAAAPVTVTDRVRYGALAFAAATVVATAMSAGWAPSYARSGLPWYWTATLLAFLIAVAVSAPAYARAWPGSQLARLIKSC